MILTSAGRRWKTSAREVLGVAGQDGLRAPGALDQLVPRVEPVVGIQPRLVVALQAVLHGGGKLAGHQDSGFRAHLGFICRRCGVCRHDVLTSNSGAQLGTVYATSSSDSDASGTATT